MTVLRFFLFALVFPATVMAQHLSHPVIASRDDLFFAPRVALSFPDTIRILAVMVQFQADNNPATTGNGQFNLSPSTEAVLDAPPHHAQFFRDHLTFVENYYRRSSKGKVVITSSLIDSVVTLPGQMSIYSPAKNASNTRVVNLVRDTWTKVDSLGLVPDFSRYNCFIVFHAGAGHDIDLLSLLGYDPGLSDIPSLYIGPSAFRTAYGQSYPGIAVNGGSFLITNSIVLPETESRSIPAAVGGDILLQFTFNGLLCASIGNYLGLPDLYNTATGVSAIGRFGLMDGSAIFSFNGAFPPQPSAWEKYWLGWITPLIVPPGSTTLSLPAIELADSVFRVPISNEEYFLVENRNRDPRRTGVTVTSTFNGALRQQHFAQDTIGFEAGDVPLLSGVITDVDEPDWSLPGGVGSDGTFYDGGVLIWHIDEAVILANLASDAVNANPDHRGVDVEEADGSQDIGQSYGFLSAGSGSEEGTALDFWFQGNSSPINKNMFSSSTFPDSRSYSGANSHITIRDFSPRGPHMSVTAARGDQHVTAFPGFPHQTGSVLTQQSLTVATRSGEKSPTVFVATTGTAVEAHTGPGLLLPPPPQSGKLYAWSPPSVNGLSPFFSNGLLAQTGIDSAFSGAPAVIDTNGDGLADALAMGQGLQSGLSPTSEFLRYGFLDSNNDSLADNVFRSPSLRSFTTSVVSGDSLVGVGSAGGWVYFFRPNGGLADSAKVIQDHNLAGLSLWTDPNSFVVTGSDGTVAITTRRIAGGVAIPDRIREFGSSIVGPAATAMFAPGKPGIAFVTNTGMLYVVDATLQPFPGFPVNIGVPVVGPPALADLDGDGVRDILVFSGSRIWAVNIAGASLDYFPYTVSAQKPIASTPIVADVDGDGFVDVVAVTGDGLVVALNKEGKMASGFPLQAGPGFQSAAVYTMGDSIALAVGSSDDGSVSAWLTGTTIGVPDTLHYPWPQFQHDAAHRGLDQHVLSVKPLTSEFFPKDRAYNWPNPVYAGKTHLRYYLRDNATVNIKILDLAGDLVTSFPGPGIGGVDNEMEWDAAGIQSGVYFARIEARSPAGSGVVIVKVAIVK